VEPEALRALAQRIASDPALAKRLAADPAAGQLLREAGPAPEGAGEAAKEPLEGDDDKWGANVPSPTSRQLRIYCASNLVPFIGFGFFDNFIMILAGDYIDARFGMAFGITTMASAALGNTFSDVIGLWVSGFIETVGAAMGLPEHGITNAQRRKLWVRILKNTSMVAGLVIGCILGMFPLVYPTEWRFWPARWQLEQQLVAASEELARAATREGMEEDLAWAEA